MTKKDVEKLTQEQQQKWDSFLEYLLKMLLSENKELCEKCTDQSTMKKEML